MHWVVVLKKAAIKQSIAGLKTSIQEYNSYAMSVNINIKVPKEIKLILNQFSCFDLY